jgi:hypothetical protein
VEYLTLITWLIVVGLALPLGALAIDHPALAVQAIAALLGLGLAVVFLAADRPAWAAWAALGCAVAGLLADAVAVAWITRDDRPQATVGQAAEEADAALLGVQLPLFACAGTIAVLGAITS